MDEHSGAPANGRPAFERAVAAAIALAKTDGEAAGIAIIALDHLDIVNIAFGFETGDRVLTDAMAILSGVVRGVDTLARISGSKFGVVVSNCDEEKLLLACQRYRSALRDHIFETAAGPVSVTVSVAAVLAPVHASTPRQAIGNVQIALEEARRDRFRSVALFRPDGLRDKRRLADARIAHNVVAAIAEDRLQLAFQPVVDATTGETLFHEALIRLRGQDGTLHDAGSFIGAADRLGLVRMLDHKALDKVLEVLAAAPEAVLSVNLSNDTAADKAWLKKLTAAIGRHPDIAPRLIIELTESQAVLDPDATLAVANAIRALGCRLAIDDFGAGYTSFAQLRSLPVDIIKIDGSFAADSLVDTRSETFLRALIAISRALGAKTVVEWVTDAPMAAQFRDWGVDCLQGFGISPPLDTSPWALAKARR